MAHKILTPTDFAQMTPQQFADYTTRDDLTRTSKGQIVIFSDKGKNRLHMEINAGRAIEVMLALGKIDAGIKTIVAHKQSFNYSRAPRRINARMIVLQFENCAVSITRFSGNFAALCAYFLAVGHLISRNTSSGNFVSISWRNRGNNKAASFSREQLVDNLRRLQF